MKYIIRRATNNDLRAIQLLFHNTVVKVNISHYNASQIKAWQRAGSAMRWGELWSSDLQFYVAESAYLEIVGFASFRPDGYIHSIFTHHKHLRCGIARALLNHIESQMAGQTIISEVSITAMPFFEHMGYNTKQQQQVNLNGTKLTNYIMTKDI